MNRKRTNTKKEKILVKTIGPNGPAERGAYIDVRPAKNREKPVVPNTKPEVPDNKPEVSDNKINKSPPIQEINQKQKGYNKKQSD